MDFRHKFLGVGKHFRNRYFHYLSVTFSLIAILKNYFWNICLANKGFYQSLANDKRETN